MGGGCSGGGICRVEMRGIGSGSNGGSNGGGDGPIRCRLGRVSVGLCRLSGCRGWNIIDMVSSPIVDSILNGVIVVNAMGKFGRSGVAIGAVGAIGAIGAVGAVGAVGVGLSNVIDKVSRASIIFKR